MSFSIGFSSLLRNESTHYEIDVNELVQISIFIFNLEATSIETAEPSENPQRIIWLLSKCRYLLENAIAMKRFR